MPTSWRNRATSSRRNSFACNCGWPQSGFIIQTTKTSVDREKELLAWEESRWLLRIPPWARQRVRFHRGLPTRFELTATQLLQRGQALRQSVHFDGLCLRNTAGKLQQVLASGLLAGVRFLDLSLEKLAEDELIALAHCPDLSELRALDLIFVDYSNVTAKALAHSPALSKLEFLKGNVWSPCLFEALTDPGVTFRLRHFYVRKATNPHVDLVRLLRAPCFERLEELHLSFNKQESASAFAALVQSPVVQQLRVLNVYDSGLDNEDMAVLADIVYAGKTGKPGAPRERDWTFWPCEAHGITVSGPFDPPGAG